MRAAYLVAYDIAEPKRWRRVYRLLMGHGDPLQLSIFVCWLSLTERKLMEESLTTMLNLKEDRLLFAELGANAVAVSEKLVLMGKARTALDAPPRWYVI